MLGGNAAMTEKIERALREFRRTARNAVRFGDDPEDSDDD